MFRLLCVSYTLPVFQALGRNQTPGLGKMENTRRFLGPNEDKIQCRLFQTNHNNDKRNRQQICSITLKIVYGVERSEIPYTIFNVGCRKIKEAHYEYSDTHNVLHVVHNHKWRHPDSVDNVLCVRPGFCVSHTKQMVPHSPRNLQRGFLLVPRVVQNCLFSLQCRSLRGSVDRRIKWIIQQSLALDGYSAALHSRK